MDGGKGPFWGPPLIAAFCEARSVAAGDVVLPMVGPLRSADSRCCNDFKPLLAEVESALSISGDRIRLEID